MTDTLLLSSSTYDYLKRFPNLHIFQHANANEPEIVVSMFYFCTITPRRNVSYSESGLLVSIDFRVRSVGLRL